MHYIKNILFQIRRRDHASNNNTEVDSSHWYNLGIELFCLRNGIMQNLFQYTKVKFKKKKKENEKIDYLF